MEACGKTRQMRLQGWKAMSNSLRTRKSEATLLGPVGNCCQREKRIFIIHKCCIAHTAIINSLIFAVVTQCLHEKIGTGVEMRASRVGFDRIDPPRSMPCCQFQCLILMHHAFRVKVQLHSPMKMFNGGNNHSAPTLLSAMTMAALAQECNSIDT